MPIERLRILDERFIQKNIEFDVHVFSALQVDLIIVKQLAWTMDKQRRPQPKRSQAVSFGPYSEDESDELDEEDEEEEFAKLATATATDLKNGIWFIHLSTNAARSVHTVQCGPTSLQLSSSMTDSQVTLSLNEIQGERYF